MTLLAGTPGRWWWRIPSWIVLVVVTVVAADGVAAKITSGALMAGSWLALQLSEWVPRVGAAAVVGSSGLAIGACFASPGGIAPVAVCIAAANAPNRLRGRALQVVTVALTVGFGVTVALISRSVLGLFAGIAVPVLVQRTQQHHDLIRERDRARALLVEAEAGRDSEAQAAALRERGRIAREMHDVLAHSLAGLSVQLQGVRAVAAREGVGPAVLEPLDRAAELAREGLSEARAAVGTLRDPVGIGLDSLPALVARQPGTVTLHVTGEGHVSSEAGHAVYRAVQEALTNAARYAPGTSVAIELVWTSTELTVTLVDTGAAPGRTAVTETGTGLGLAGMTERVGAVGGSVEAGPYDAGWRVRVTVPVS